jgi:hypothetical protein
MSLQKALVLLQLSKISINKYNTFFNNLSCDICELIIDNTMYLLDKIFDLPPNTEIKLYNLKTNVYNKRIGIIMKYLITKDRYMIKLHKTYNDNSRIMNIYDMNIIKQKNTYWYYVTNNTFKFIPGETNIICLYCGEKNIYDEHMNSCDICTCICSYCSVDAIVEDIYSIEQLHKWHREGFDTFNINPFE